MLGLGKKVIKNSYEKEVQNILYFYNAFSFHSLDVAGYDT